MKTVFKTIVALSFFTLSMGCVQPDQVESTLRKAGFTDIRVRDLNLLACGEDDTLQGRDFTAKNPQGMMVSGVVCCGMFKGCTVRF